MSTFTGTVVDVRTREEFMAGHVADSVNIPLQEIQEHVAEIKAMKTPILFCCAAGIRSGQATAYFQSLGIECANGGSWMDVNGKLNS